MTCLLACLLLLALPAPPAPVPARESVELSGAWGERFFSAPDDITPLETAAATYGDGLPFSLVYDGRPSAGLVGRWHRVDSSWGAVTVANLSSRTQEVQPTGRRRRVRRMEYVSAVD